MATSCQSPADKPAATVSKEDALDAVALQLIEAEDHATPTRLLTQDFPELDRPTAYQIQLMTLKHREEAGAVVRGYKMGGTGMRPAGAPADPSFGYSLDAHLYEDGQSIPASTFINGQVLVEAEIAVLIGQDLPGPTVSREQLEAAVSGIAGGIELISPRLLPATEGGEAPSINYAIADKLSHGGAIIGQTKVGIGDIDLASETVVATVNGEQKAEGSSSIVMDQDPLAVALWLANELPKHGRHLKAGDYILTGSLYQNPTIQAGDEATVTFAHLGSISVSLSGE